MIMTEFVHHKDIAEQRLDELYILVGETNGKVDDSIFDEIYFLEQKLLPIVNPIWKPLELYKCDCGDCWECACKDCPEDI